jgi:hypothetical protein
VSERLARQFDLTLRVENFGINPAQITDTSVQLGPPHVGETWVIRRITLRGEISTSWGATALQVPYVYVWRNQIGGWLLDKWQPPKDTTGKRLGDSTLEAVSETEIELLTAESMVIQVKWDGVGISAPIPPPNSSTGWNVKAYVEGRIDHGVS